MAELIWEGKYDANGRRVAPVRVSLPFQTVETVNESAQERQRSLDLFGSGHDVEWRNRLIWGDNKYILPALLDEFGGKVDLIYIDPPFATGQDFSFTTRIPESDSTFIKEASLLEQKAYRDTWGRGIESYLQMLDERIALICDLLADGGYLFLHLGSNVSHYAKILCDGLLGPQSYVNEIIWKRQTAHSDIGQGSRHLGRLHDVILLYRKGGAGVWNMAYTDYETSYTDSFYKFVEPETGRHYGLGDITGPRGAAKGNPFYEFLGVTRYWRFSRERMEALYDEGRVVQVRPGAVPRQKRYLDELEGVPLQDMWTDIPPIQSQAHERVGYETQKPEALLERIINLATDEGGLVMDVFGGSGTTAVAAEKLNRRWIVADLGRFAITTSRKRLLSIPDVKPFVVQNLGKYERQAWESAEFGQDSERRQLSYRRFILELYHAQAVDGRLWLHGLKNGRMVHVGSVDAPVSTGDVTQIALELKRSIGSGEGAPKSNGVDVLGWDFAFELNEVAKQQAALAGIDMRFVRIPRDVMDKRAVEQGDVKFFELAALSVDVQTKGRAVTLTLTDFIIPLDDVPEAVQRAITNWSQWIDYWAVDWDNRSDTFHNQWQAYRTRQNRNLEKSVTHTYQEPGTYKAVIKVIDILGNDTTKTIEAQVA